MEGGHPALWPQESAGGGAPVKRRAKLSVAVPKVLGKENRGRMIKAEGGDARGGPAGVRFPCRVTLAYHRLHSRGALPSKNASGSGGSGRAGRSGGGQRRTARLVKK